MNYIWVLLIPKDYTSRSLGRSGLGGDGLAVLSIQNFLAGLVHLDLGDLDVGGVDANVDGLTVGLIAGDSLDVDNVLLSVNLGDLALLTGELSTDNSDLVVLSDGEGADLGNVK